MSSPSSILAQLSRLLCLFHSFKPFLSISFIEQKKTKKLFVFFSSLLPFSISLYLFSREFAMLFLLEFSLFLFYLLPSFTNLDLTFYSILSYSKYTRSSNHLCNCRWKNKISQFKRITEKLFFFSKLIRLIIDAIFQLSAT